MKERTYPEGISDMAASAQSQASELLKCGQAIEASGSNVAGGGYDARPYAYRALDEAMQAVGMATTASGHDGAATSLLRAAEALESRASDAQRMGWDAEAKDCATKAAAARKKSLEHAAAALAMAPKPGMLVKALHGLRDLLKSQVGGYTKKDGTVVQAYSNKVQKIPGKVGSNSHREAVSAHLAKEHLGFDDLETKNSDSADFKDTSKWGMKTALEQAYHHGFGGKGGDPEKASAAAMEAAKRHTLHDSFDVKNSDAEDFKDTSKAGARAALATAYNKGVAHSAADELQNPTKKKESVAKKDSGAKALLVKKDAPGSEKQPSADGAATGATPEQLNLMEASLANDEEASDDELVAHFVEQGVPEAVAKQAVTHRDAFTSTAIPETGLLTKLMKKDAAGKGGAPDAGAVSRGTEGAPGAGGAAGGPAQGADAAADAPPHADANEAGWGNLPDAENPQHAMSGFSSKHLGKLATMKPEHAKAHAHAELQNRGLDAKGEWAGFDKAKAEHAKSIPQGFQPVHGDDQDSNGFQQVHRKVLSAAAQGHLDLQKRAKAELANRGHDHSGNWVGFEKANAMHMGGKAGDLTKSILFVGGGR